MGWLQDVQRGWFGKRRDPVRLEDNKSFVVPGEDHPANAHTVSPVGAYDGAETETIEQAWGRLDNYRSPDPTTHDAPQHHDQKEYDNRFVEPLYKTAPSAQMETYDRSPDARWAPVQVTRPTGTQSNARVINPFDQGTARRFDGTHFSMASMQRTYPIGGMLPAAVARRNTYRLDPLPHDLGVVDMPGNGRFPNKETQLVEPTNPMTYGRSYRLG